MKAVIVASENPVKIKAVEGAFRKMFPQETFTFTGVKALSGVSDQPKSDAETKAGAINRAKYIKRRHPKAHYWASMEGGVDWEGKEMRSVVWVVVLSKNQRGLGKTASFTIPPRIAKLVRGGMELGLADDKVFNRKNSKQQNGAAGLLTNNVVTRTDLYEQGVILALIPFLNPKLYPKR